MGKKQFSEERIAFALRQAESGTSVAEIIRKLGISEQTFYRWKKRFAGPGIVELLRLRTLEQDLGRGSGCSLEIRTRSHTGFVGL
jgi:putative transposase